MLPNTTSEFRNAAEAYLPGYNTSQYAEIFAAYDPVSLDGSVQAAYVQATGDSDITCPTLMLAGLLAEAVRPRGGRVYYYNYGGSIPAHAVEMM